MDNSIVVLQARSTSSRLPAKVLLPIQGLPVVVLAAQRAQNTGKNVIVVTSQESSDDYLAETVLSHGLQCFRGDLNDVLGRFVAALSEYDDDAIVFRLTSDNVFPDGAFLDEMEKDFIEKKYNYLTCYGNESGLPYGVTAEVTKIGFLREAAQKATMPYDREHVTPYLKRKFGVHFFEKYQNLKKAHLRCSIDFLEDYFEVQRVFSKVKNPTQEPFLNLIQRLEGGALQPFVHPSVPKFVLGTAQLGFDYGITNKTGQPSLNDAMALIKGAIANGVHYLDTARAYGSSEKVIGASLKNGWQERVNIITKLSLLNNCPKDASHFVLNAFVEESLFKSFFYLGVERVDTLIVHRASHLFDWCGGVLEKLLAFKASGQISHIGVSVQNVEELDKVLDISDISHIQIPMNILDWRWESLVPKVNQVKKVRPLTIHARSALLQGLLQSEEENHWAQAHVKSSIVVRDWLTDQVKKCQKTNIVELCLSYLNSLSWIDGIVVGLENMEQLIQNIKYFCSPVLTSNQIENIVNTRPKLSENSLNPALWKK